MNTKLRRMIAVSIIACGLMGHAGAQTTQTLETALEVESFTNPDALPVGTTATVPVILYHHFDTVSTNSMTVTPERFAEQLDALQAAGYNTVSVADMIAFVDEGVALPENPIWITFDDGYASNLEIAAPLMAERDMNGTLFAIGVTNGATTYRDTSTEIIAHYDYADAQPWIDAGTVEVMSHGYDIHQVVSLDGEDARVGAIFLEGETLFAYMDMFITDATQSITDIETALGTTVTAFAYPYGIHNGVTEGILRTMGVRVTATIARCTNVITVGDPDSLYAMGRLFAVQDQTGAQLLADIRALEVNR